MNKLLNFKYNDYSSYETDSLNYDIDDTGYKEFLKQGNDGFYFSKALHIYGLSQDAFHNVNIINDLFSKEYSFLDKKYQCFACDLFGNQFCFTKSGVVQLNIETCEEEILANNFAEWTTIILSDQNYYSGQSILLDWENVLSPIEFRQRLIPKTPFVIGGEYSPKNMIAIDFFKAISYNASIAKQIYNVPDGTSIELKVGSPPTN